LSEIEKHVGKTGGKKSIAHEEAPGGSSRGRKNSLECGRAENQKELEGGAKKPSKQKRKIGRAKLANFEKNRTKTRTHETKGKDGERVR